MTGRNHVRAPVLGALVWANVYVTMVEGLQSERRSIRWERALIGLLAGIIALEITAAFRTGEVWWALCAAPLVLGSLIIARNISGRKRMTDELAFRSELFVGPHSPWTTCTPEAPTQ